MNSLDRQEIMYDWLYCKGAPSIPPWDPSALQWLPEHQSQGAVCRGRTLANQMCMNNCCQTYVRGWSKADWETDRPICCCFSSSFTPLCIINWVSIRLSPSRLLKWFEPFSFRVSKCSRCTERPHLGGSGIMTSLEKCHLGPGQKLWPQWKKNVYISKNRRKNKNTKVSRHVTKRLKRYLSTGKLSLFRQIGRQMPSVVNPYQMLVRAKQYAAKKTERDDNT